MQNLLELLERHGMVLRWASSRTGPPLVAGPAALDLCHVGVVLRAVLGVHITLSIACLFFAANAHQWLLLFAPAVAGGLPGTLVWLLLLCFTQGWWGRWAWAPQWAVGLGLGAVAGVLGAGVSAGFTLSWPLQVSTVLASALAGSVGAYVVLGWLRLRQAQQRPADIQARWVELQSRIRPHFLFNTLNSAITLVRLDPRRAEVMLEDLAALFRAVLAEPRMAVSLADEVNLAQRYVAIEQARFGQRLQLNWDLAPEALTARLPPLILQPLVENAVLHGIEPCEAGGHVDVHAEVRAGNVVLTVRNTLPALTPANAGQQACGRSGHGMALSNIRERLHLMHDVAASFEAGQETVAGETLFRVCMIIPIQVPGIEHERQLPA